MARVKTVRDFVQQRLTAAAEEIVEMFERTILEYEETLRHGKPLGAVSQRQVPSQRADVQLLSVSREEITPEKQEWSPNLNQDDSPEVPHINDGQEELWTSQGAEQRQGLDEADIIKFAFNAVPVKSEEDDEEKPQPSKLHHTEVIKTEADREDCREPEPEKNSIPNGNLQPVAMHEAPHLSQQETYNRFILRDTSDPQYCLNTLKNNEELQNNTVTSPVPSSECASSFDHYKHLQGQTGIKTGVKPFSCSVCCKKYNWKSSFTAHMRLHSEGKSLSCSLCTKTFPFRANLLSHMRVHTGEKPFSCSVCSSRFTRKHSLREHMRIHSGEKPYSCSVCGTRFIKRVDMLRHLRVHTGEKPFSCTVCGKRFTEQGNVRKHMRTHTGEKPFSCSVCDKRFTQLINLKKHKCVGGSSGSK